MEGSEPPLHPRLSHLDGDDLAELIRLYYSGERVAMLMEAFNIKGNPSGFVSLLPPVVHDDLTCTHCNDKKMISKRLSRDRTQKALPYCPSCGHSGSLRCVCQACKDSAFAKNCEIEERKRAVIRSKLSSYRSPELDIESLTFCEAVFLLANFRHSVADDLVTASPFISRREPLAPTEEMRDEMVRMLRQKFHLAVSPESKSEAFNFADDLSDCPTCNMLKVDWLFLPGIQPEAKKTFIAELERVAREGPWPEHWQTEAFDFWFEIAKAECFEYYSLLLSERRFEATFGDKTHAVFDNLLQTFSIGQVFNLTNQAVKNTTDYIYKNKFTANHAKNSFISAIQRAGDKHRAEGWNTTAYKRNFDCPQSIVSAVFFDLFLGVGGKALETLPRINWQKGAGADDAEIPF